jgi:hypothetical protein
VGKAEHLADGANPRFVVTNLIDDDELVRLARSSFRILRAKVRAFQAGAVRWGRRVARSIEPLGGCVG